MAHDLYRDITREQKGLGANNIWSDKLVQFPQRLFIVKALCDTLSANTQVLVYSCFIVSRLFIKRTGTGRQTGSTHIDRVGLDHCSYIVQNADQVLNDIDCSCI